ncbi:MAG: hypothetical protein ACRDI2_18350 [Chloroflexota bacterium]
MPAAMHAVPAGVDWAEVAAIEGRSLGVVMSGEWDGYRWQWSPLLDARHDEAIGVPFGNQAT